MRDAVVGKKVMIPHERSHMRMIQEVLGKRRRHFVVCTVGAHVLSLRISLNPQTQRKVDLHRAQQQSWLSLSSQFHPQSQTAQ